MSQPDPSTPALFSGPTFHASGIQLVTEGDQVSLYFTTTRHAFGARDGDIRALNELVCRLVVTNNGAARIADMLQKYCQQLASATPPVPPGSP